MQIEVVDVFVVRQVGDVFDDRLGSVELDVAVGKEDGGTDAFMTPDVELGGHADIGHAAQMPVGGM